jgi:ubiquinone/menaquinone biosynthesis C-methylase UbiE
MFEMHREVHEAAIADIAASECSSVAEVACGSAFNCEAAGAHGLAYTGIDISETAIAIACLKQSAGDFINLPVDRLEILKDRSFDAVYNSSMLEHIGFADRAIRSMWRLADRRLDLILYDGLSDQPEDSIRFFPHASGITARQELLRW